MAVVDNRSYPEFKKLFETAQREKKLTFDFQGQQILTAYAKYVVLYVEGEKLRQQKPELN